MTRLLETNHFIGNDEILPKAIWDEFEDILVDVKKHHSFEWDDILILSALPKFKIINLDIELTSQKFHILFKNAINSGVLVENWKVLEKIFECVYVINLKLSEKDLLSLEPYIIKHINNIHSSSFLFILKAYSMAQAGT